MFFRMLLLLLLPIFSYMLFQNYNQEFHTLEKSEFDVKIYKLNEQKRWVPYKKENNSSLPQERKEIKSILTFKKSGLLFLNFSYTQKEPEQARKSPIAYRIVQNKKAIDSFMLTENRKHQTSLKVARDDEVKIYVTINGLSSYWGTLKSSFKVSPFYIIDLLILFLWIGLFIFLSYRKYDHLAILAYSGFSLMVMAEMFTFGRLSFQMLLSYTILLFFWTFLFLWIYQIFSKLKQYKPALIVISTLSGLLWAIPVLFIFYYLNFEHSLSKESLYAIFQSNSNESLEYLEKFVSWGYFVLFFLLYLFMIWLIYRQEKRETMQINNYLLWGFILLFGAISYTQFSNIRVGNFLFEHFEKYTKELQRFKEVQEKRATGEIDFNATKGSNAELHIVVIGESLNKNHMGLYGYMRDTTPNLSALYKEGKLIRFNNVYSNHTHTVPVLSFSLTQANQYNHKNYYESLSIIEILKKAKVESYWLSNQNIYGEWDNMISVLATGADKLISINHTIGCNVETQQYDEALIAPFNAILAQKSSKNRVVFIHLMGSHSVYGSRYPNDRFSIFTKKLDANVFGKSAKVNQEMNRYDNTVYYNDYVVSTLLKALQKHKGVSSFIYMSDHADDINRDLGHSKDHFSYEMTQIPFLAWFSQDYREQYPQKYKRFLENQEQLFSNDMLYDTLVGLFDIKTNQYNPRYDLSSVKFTLNEKEALVMHGERRYAEEANHKYWQKKSIAYLKKNNLMSRIIPLHLNTVGVKQEALKDGFKRLAIEEGLEYHSKEQKAIALSDIDFIEKISKEIQENNESKILVNYESDFNR